MHTILFDIDGTLLATGGAGMQAIAKAMDQMFEIRTLPLMEVHGRTDHGILKELFEQLSLDFDKYFHGLSQRYWELLPESLARLPGRVLPGVRELLDVLSERPDVQLGLLTGNAQCAAEIKLAKFGLASYFQFGGYGDFHCCRNEVARLAVEAARVSIGDKFNSGKMWVIGDTIHDINCARAIGSRVIAVETGGANREELRQAKPDFQFSSFENQFAEVLAVFETQS